MSFMRAMDSTFVPRTTTASSVMTAPILTPIDRSANHPSRRVGSAVLLMYGISRVQRCWLAGGGCWSGHRGRGWPGRSGADGAVDVEGEEQLAVELVRAADQVP